LEAILHNRLHGGAIATALDTVGGFAVTLAIAEKYAGETADQLFHVLVASNH
jgi:acyl-coenzyme A thioesterase PaaI-like protein